MRPAPLLGFGGPRTAVDAPSHAPGDSERSAADGTALRRTPPGVEATLFASEPLLASPTNLDVDRHGRVWVIDVMNYAQVAREVVVAQPTPARASATVILDG